VESNSAEFKEWLSGKCSYSDPPDWTCHIRENRVAIVPGWRLIAILSAMVLFAAGVTGGVFWEKHSGRDILSIGVMLFMGAFGIIVIGGLGTALVASVLEHFKGPYLFYSDSDRKISLPRLSFVVSRASAVGWRVVSGNWIGPQNAQKFKESPMSELHLIVNTPTGLVAYTVVGAYARSDYSVTEKFQQIARATGLPIETVEQHQGITEKAVSKQVQNWRSGGM
jgi:hypothetical protein